MLGDAKKYLEKWRSENEEKTDKKLLACKERDEQRNQEEAQQMMRREASRGDIQNITEILHNQSLANAPKPKQKQSLVSESTSTVETTIEKENDAWRSLEMTSGANQTAPENTETVKKKRAYVRKVQKKEMQGDSGPSKSKE
jgi:hypothetical protein